LARAWPPTTLLRVSSAMLSHPWRVLAPEEADLFYVPIY
ncbi:unnamed protein product, partial [Ectocarpus fasciculatus]